MKRVLVYMSIFLFLLTTNMVIAQSLNVDNILLKNERAAVQYFWNEVNPANGLVRDRTTWNSPSSIAAVGFGLTSLCIAVEHGWLPRADVYNRILTTLEYFKNLPNEHGFFYHFLNLWTGERAFSSEISPIDTTLFIAGALFAGQYFKGTAVQELASQLYRQIDWQWMTNHAAYINMAWTPERGFFSSYWTGYSEAVLMYLLAIGSPTHPISPSSWKYWIRTWSKKGTGVLEHWGSTESLFTYLYSEAYVDFRYLNFRYVGNLWDNSQKGIKYIINFARGNSQYKTFKNGFWGISASDGPTGYRGYGAVSGGFDGTVAPYAMIASLPLVPNQSKEAIMKMWNLKNEIYGRYGFVDAFNLDQNWRDFQYVGIDVGIETLMTENYYTAMIWKYFMEVPYVQKALDLVGVKRLSVPESTREATSTKTLQKGINYIVIENFSKPYGNYGLGIWTGGTSVATDASAKIISSGEFGHVWDVFYNVEKKGAYNGSWLALANTNLNHTFDASKYSKLVFYVKSSSLTPMNFKIELKSFNNGVGYYYVKKVTNKWVKIVVPFREFKKYSWTNKVDYSKLTQMTFVFENSVDTVKSGHIYIANIGFSK